MSALTESWMIAKSLVEIAELLRIITTSARLICICYITSGEVIAPGHELENKREKLLSLAARRISNQIFRK